MSSKNLLIGRSKDNVTKQKGATPFGELHL